MFFKKNNKIYTILFVLILGGIIYFIKINNFFFNRNINEQKKWVISSLDLSLKSNQDFFYPLWKHYESQLWKKSILNEIIPQLKSSKKTYESFIKKYIITQPHLYKKMWIATLNQIPVAFIFLNDLENAHIFGFSINNENIPSGAYLTMNVWCDEEKIDKKNQKECLEALYTEAIKNAKKEGCVWIGRIALSSQELEPFSLFQQNFSDTDIEIISKPKVIGQFYSVELSRLIFLMTEKDFETLGHAIQEKTQKGLLKDISCIPFLSLSNTTSEHVYEDLWELINLSVYPYELGSFLKPEALELLTNNHEIKLNRIQSFKNGDLWSAYDRLGGQCWVAIDKNNNNKIVGRLVMSESSEQIKRHPELSIARWLSGLSVHPKYYGRGIAQKLIYEAAKHPTVYPLKDMNIDPDHAFMVEFKGFPIGWDMWASVKSARQLYKKIIAQDVTTTDLKRTSVCVPMVMDQITLNKKNNHLENKK